MAKSDQQPPAPPEPPVDPGAAGAQPPVPPAPAPPEPPAPRVVPENHLVLIAPDNCTNATHDGISYDVDVDGSLVAPAHVARELVESHGFIALDSK